MRETNHHNPSEGITSEIQIIEKSIAKFGALLHVGFGEAGVSIIARNMLRGYFDPVQPGKKVVAIFGFCDIRNFTDCSEVLKEAVMIFTNQIARIVHNSVHASGGDVNKNIGDAFLAVWKLSDDDDEEIVVAQTSTSGGGGSRSGGSKSSGERKSRSPYSLNTQESSITSAKSPSTATSPMQPTMQPTMQPPKEDIELGHPSPAVTPKTPAGFSRSLGTRRRSYVHHLTKDPTVPDKALKSFLDIITLLDKSPSVQMYAKSSALQAKLGKGFRVRMGFGLHLGWGIEGAIGTRHKIDASYLSPHVNMSARLEAATKQYGVTLLLTHVIHDQLLATTQLQCRPLDRVTVKGSTEPVTLYTHDTSSTGEQSCLALAGTTHEDHLTLMKQRKQYCSRLVLEQQTLNVVDFQNEWCSGFQAYVDGDWSTAVEKIKKCLVTRPWDSPCKVLLKYIRNAGMDEGDSLHAPADWRGYRSLNSK